jgi:dihydropteroate synthase
MKTPKIMGIVNVTPDSFSDGGQFTDPQAAIAHGKTLAEAGADMLDVGGESTRPGAEPVSEEEEMERVLPVIYELSDLGLPVSVDTYKPAVARAAMDAGAAIWNDVRALQEPGALETAAELDCNVVLMHMQGEPRSMQTEPRYDDVVAEVILFLQTRAIAALDAGVKRERIWLDPGIGFGKTAAHNLSLLKHLDMVVSSLGMPVVLGLSRKGFIEGLHPAPNRLGGSLAGALIGAARGAAVVRVHDVAETAQAFAMRQAVEGAE